MSDNKKIWEVTFFTKGGAEIDSYSTKAMMTKGGGTYHDLEENEELIGVYGVRGKNKYQFTSFGFIALVHNKVNIN